jgi:hypothetical protein
MIHPVLLYGSQTWVLIKKEENQLLVVEWKILRKSKMLSTGEATPTSSIKSFRL